MKTYLVIIGFLLIAIQLKSQNIISTEKIPEVVIKGTGETNMLLIPCMGCRWNEWEEFMERNLDNYTMYAITAPGFGGTMPPDLPKNSEETPYREFLLTGLSELIDSHNIKDLTVVGHSWGVMVALQLAAKRSDVINRMISVDGKITGARIQKDYDLRIKQANQLVEEWGAKLQNAEEWSTFNGASVGLIVENQDSISKETMQKQIKLKTSLMATDRTAMLQYWRENLMIDISEELNKLDIPILDIQSFTGKNQHEQKQKYFEVLESSTKSIANVESVFMFDTKHFIMYHRPKELDCMIENFNRGEIVNDFAPSSSEYFDDEVMN